MKLKDRRMSLIASVLNLVSLGKEYTAEDYLLRGEDASITGSKYPVEAASEMPGYKDDWNDALMAYRLQRKEDAEQVCGVEQRGVEIRYALLQWCIKAMDAL